VICPRCSVGEISEATQECLVCGFSRTGGVLVESGDWSPHDDPVLPSLERQFQVEGVLRRGAASRIYLARDQVKGRLCSLKVLPLTDAAPGTVDRFRKDAQRAAALDHPHIVVLHSFGTSADAVWYATEYVQGRSLGDLLRTADRMDLKTCLRLVEQIASALEYGHRRGVTHGNLKPTNVLVDPENWVRVTDFGLSGAFGSLPRRQPEASFEENFGHVAPERFGSAGVAGPASDQYALAVLAFACLARRAPFVGDTMDEIARQHLEGTPPPIGDTRPDLPPHVATTLARAMSRKPENRFAGVLDFATALAGVPVVEPVATIPVVAGPALVKDEPPSEPVTVAPAAKTEQPVETAEAAHPPLLFVNRGGNARAPETDDEDDEDDVDPKDAPKVAAKLVPDDDDDELEENDAATPQPVLLWPPTAREVVDAASQSPDAAASAQKAEEERRALLILENSGATRSVVLARAAIRVRQLVGRWQTLPKRVRQGGGVGAAAAVLLLAVVWWRVARGHEERNSDRIVIERPPAGLDTAAPRTQRATQRPRNPSSTTRSTTPTTRPTTRPTTVAQADTGRNGTGTPVQSSKDPAHLFINATPWGLLFIDDRPMGNTPRADLQVPPGIHRIRITRDGYLPYETEIAIEAGETLRLTDIVLQERPQ
jgi:predicted Ser/Thr protein kinase